MTTGNEPVRMSWLLNVIGAKAIGTILTGVGNHGAAGLKRMRDAGIFTIGLDQASSVVLGMLGSAVKLYGVCQVMPLTKIVPYLLKSLKTGQRQPAI